MGGWRRPVDEIPAEQFTVVGANIRTLRLRKGGLRRSSAS